MTMYLDQTQCNTLKPQHHSKQQRLMWLINIMVDIYTADHMLQTNMHAHVCSNASKNLWQHYYRGERKDTDSCKPREKGIGGKINPPEPSALNNMLRDSHGFSRRTCLYHDVEGRKELVRCELCDSFHFLYCTPACGARDTRTRRHLAW